MQTSHQVYNAIEVETEIGSASGHRLIQLLYERCLQQIKTAVHCVETKQVNKKYKSISNATDIIYYLRFCLNKEDPATRELVNLLSSIYDFLESHLLKASLKNDTHGLNEAYNVLSLVKSGWDEISA